MRSGGYALHHSLTLEAAAVVKHAISLARRRGHAQVTPLHVASAMLVSSTGLLKRACLQSHSHPLQCKALELCFNVALNRLPTSASSTLLGPHCHIPSLSNALVAAFKRAQAHQRRGTVENHQQPVLALKVEVEQLVISILDDPSISRVMREAGFSSIQVKANVEKAMSKDRCKSRSPSSIHEGHPKELGSKNVIHAKGTLSQATPSASLGQFKLSLGETTTQAQNDDVTSVLEAMLNKKGKNTVIITECPASAEAIVKELIHKFNKKDVPTDMKLVQFISVPLFTLRNISKEEFEVKLSELRSIVKSYAHGGVVLYLGDLDFVSKFWSEYGQQRDGYYSSPVEYVIMELSRLMFGEKGESRRLWLMGTATLQTYAKCKMGRPSLETLWNLHPLHLLPVGSLALSLSLDCTSERGAVKDEPVDDFNWILEEEGAMELLTCCSDCSDNFKKEAQAATRAKQKFPASTSISSLPFWLQQCKDENRNHINVSDKVKDLVKKWNSICSKTHGKTSGFLLNLSSPSSPCSSSTSSNDHTKHKLHKTLLDWPLIFTKEDHQIFLQGNNGEAKPELLSNPNSSPNSASSSEASQEPGFSHKFKCFNSDNFDILSNALERKAPWQREIIPDIVTTVLKCRSRMVRAGREETWLFFSGIDHDGKEIVARELAKSIFASYDSFTAIGISSFSSPKTDESAGEVMNNERGRDEHGGIPYDRFLEAARDNPSRVIFIKDADQMGCSSLKGFRRAMEEGNAAHPDNGEVVLLRDAIVIFSCESSSSAPGRNYEQESGEEEEAGDGDHDQMKMEKKELGFLDLNAVAEGDEEDDNGVLGMVDKQVVFKIQVL